MKKYLTGLILLVGLLSSCIGRPAEVSDGKTKEMETGAGSQQQKAGKVEAALIDATGSYSELVPALRRLSRFAGDELNEGDTFCAFWIKGGVGDSVDFLIEPVTLPVPQRRIGDPAEVDSLALKKRIQNTLSSYANAHQFKKADRTDLIQAIAYAGRLLHAGSNKSREKWLLLFTDLEDNQMKEADLALEGVHVRVFYVPARNDLKGLDKKFADWKRSFERAKAASIEIYDVGESESLSRLLDPG